MRDQFQSVQERFQSELVTINEAATRFFGTAVSHFSLRRWICKGVGKPPIKLPAIRIGGRYFLRPCDVAEFLESQQADPDSYRRRQASARCEKAKKRLAKAGA